MRGLTHGAPMPDLPCPWCGEVYPTRYTLRSMLAWFAWMNWHEAKHTIRRREEGR